jgi:hypothetical protein
MKIDAESARFLPFCPRKKTQKQAINAVFLTTFLRKHDFGETASPPF